MSVLRMAVLDGAADLVYLMRGALTAEGWDVQIFPDAEALATARGAKPHVVLLDIATQREAESWEMLTNLKSDPRTAPYPVIVTSASQFELQNHDDLLTEYAAAVLVRPCTEDDILRCLNAAMEQSPARR